MAGGRESRENMCPSEEADLKHPAMKIRNVSNEVASHGGTVNGMNISGHQGSFGNT